MSRSLERQRRSPYHPVGNFADFSWAHIDSNNSEKEINSASSNEQLKIGEKREKRGYFVTSNGHQRQRGRRAEYFFGNQTFYAL